MALDTAARYFEVSGRSVQDRRLMVHSVKMVDERERRWLVLANRAIGHVERELASTALRLRPRTSVREPSRLSDEQFRATPTSASGQKAKYSPRADVFWFGPNNIAQ
jgi:hypothetical protein